MSSLKMFNDAEGIIVTKVNNFVVNMESVKDSFDDKVTENVSAYIECGSKYIVVKKDSINTGVAEGSKIWLDFNFGKTADLDNLCIQFGISTIKSTGDHEVSLSIEEKLAGLGKYLMGNHPYVVLKTVDRKGFRTYIRPYAKKSTDNGVGLNMLDYLEAHFDVETDEDLSTVKHTASEVYAAFVKKVVAEVK